VGAIHRQGIHMFERASAISLDMCFLSPRIESYLK
jgi:hypothetical protein